MSTPAPIDPSIVSVNAIADWSGPKFHLATLAFQRAVQLKNGARPRLDAKGHGVIRVALMEVMAGLVSWESAP